ncbi:MAG: DUF1194 domain-containing protein [Pseudomonadota bacterium]
MSCRSVWLFALILYVIWPTQSLGQEREPVDLELVLAIDASTSVDEAEFALQREGLANAFRHPDVIAAIQSAGELGIAVAVVQWASRGRQTLSVDWTRIRTDQDGTRMARRIAEAPRYVTGLTDIAGAIRFSLQSLDTNRFEGRRRVIDVSGDGSGNAAESEAARNVALARNVVINGLVIDNEDIDLGELAKIDIRDHYARHVVGGPGAFLMNATDFVDFERAIRRKLIREILGPAIAKHRAADRVRIAGDHNRMRKAP